MNKIFTLFAFLLISAGAMSQTVGTIKGKLTDSTNKKQSMKDASITVLDAKDSTMEVFGLAKPDGSFNLTNIALGQMIIQVKFSGYETFSKIVTFSATSTTIDLGTIYMATAANELAGVTVSASVLRMKGDTMEVSASSFKTKPNAVAEDLLKKIPGMEVAKDGTIKSQGETVQRVLLNGKRFFGDDPKMATKNLPPDMIDKIQVFDDQSDQAKFSGFDDGNRVKTINITTKKEARKGAFGKVVAGLGSKINDELRLDNSFNLNVMDGDRQWTFMGQANNINKQNFQQQNIGGGRGGNGGGGGGGGAFGGAAGGGSTGITDVLAGGLNYRDAWSKNIDAYGSYFYNRPRVFVDTKSNTKSILSDATENITDAASTSNSRNENHRFTFNIENRLDSNNSLIFRPNLALQNSNPDNISTSTTIRNPGKVLVNTTNSKSSSYNSGYNINGSNLTLRHRFAKKGRTLSLDLGLSASENNGDGILSSLNSYYLTGKADTLNQHYVDSTKSLNFSPTLSYTEPIGRNQMIELKYSFAYNDNTSINKTYDFDNANAKYSKFDSLFSNSYKYTSSASTANLSWRIQKAKFNLSVGTGLQFLDINSVNTTKNVTVARDFVNFTPNVNFTYNFTRTKSLRLFYNGRTGLPTAAQLQPIVTTTDLVNFQVGNANLKPQFTNSVRALYTSFDPFTQHVIFATINATATQNDIQSSIVQDPNTGGRTTTYVNLNGTYNLSGYFSYGFPIKTPKSNLTLQTNLNYAQSQSLFSSSPSIAPVSTYTRSSNLGETIKWTTNLKKNFDMNLSTSYSINPVRSTLSSSQNTDYTTLSTAADFTVYSNNGWIIASDFDLTHYGNRPDGYNTSVFLITPSIAKQFLKNKAGELRLSCFDVLKQNKAVAASAVGNQQINTITNNLTQYFMLTFTYNLRSFAGQQQQQRGGQRMTFPGGQGNFRGDGGGFGGGGGGQRRGGGDE